MSDKYWGLIHGASQHFTPGSPINRRALFAGRKPQLDRVVESLMQPGRHPVIYGQRGVGKTSLANMLCDSISGALTMRVSCDGSDNFRTIWNRVLSTASIDVKQKAFGLSKKDVTEKTRLSDYLRRDLTDVTPSDVAAVVRMITSTTLIVLDEFDKITDLLTKAYTADLIKNLSDKPNPATLVIVGVGSSILDLVGEHTSISRNLVQVELPQMTDDEVKAILRNGFEALSFKVSPAVYDEAVMLADGFPHYAHLLGLNSAKACYRNETNNLDEKIFHLACEFAIQDAVENFRDQYGRATATTQASRVPLILCACSYAHHDARGVFKATDVVEAMNRVFKIELNVQSVVPALGQFASAKRCDVLTKVPLGNRSQYKFSDSMMRPFLRIKAQSLLANMY